MTATTTVFAALGASGGIGAVWTVYDGIRKGRAAKRAGDQAGQQIIVDSAIKLLDPYKQELRELKAQQAADRTTITALTAELDVARRDLKDLTERFTSLEAEATWLRTQVPGRSRPQT